MKNTFKVIGIIALLAVIGFSFASCGDAGDSGSTVTNEKAVYKSVDAEGNVYELTITPKAGKAAYEPKAGDTYTLKISFVDGTTKTSVGTVTHEVKSGSTVTATLSVFDSSFTVTLSTVTDGLSVMTEIKGTIPITDDDSKPTIEIELTLTPQVENESDVVIGVILNKTALELDVGGSETLVATVLPTNAKNKSVSWSSSNPAVAQVSQSGEVSALAVGSATITVTTEDGGKEAICNVMVKEVVIIDIAVTGVSLNKDTLSLVVGTSETLIATVAPDNATNKNVTWSSSDDAVATVSANGEVSAKVAGSVTITVKTDDGGFTATCAVTVPSEVPNQTPAAEDYNITGIGTFTADGAPKVVTIQPKSGKSPGAVTVLYNGSTNAPSAVGIYAITFNVATANGWDSATGFSAGTLVISPANIPVTGVTLNKTTLEIGIDETEYLTAIISPTNATNTNVTWSSNAPTIASVSESGLVTGIAIGSATITVKTEDGGFTATCNVNVYLTPAYLEAYLTTLPENSASSPHLIKLRVRSTEEFETIREALRIVNKYVNLDLSSSTVTTIPDFAFHDNNYLGEHNCTTLLIGITMPNSVTSIGDYAFYCCYNLASLTIPNSVTSIGSSAFAACTSLASLNIPNSVTSIGEYAFGACDLLTSVTIPNSVTSIGKRVFESCLNLISISVDSGNNLYSSDNGILYNKSKSTLILCPEGKSGEVSTIPKSVTSIGGNAFEECRKITSVTIPASVTSIGDKAFLSCTSLASIDIPNSVTSIGDTAFAGCTSLTSVTIGNNVTSIGYEVFSYCFDLASVIFEEPCKVTSIGEKAFEFCTSLASIDIPNSVTSIVEKAFSYCYNLTSVTIGNSVTSIGAEAFAICQSLASVTIPDSVKIIGKDVFTNCYWLTSVTFLGTIPSSGFHQYAFSSSSIIGDFRGELRYKFFETDPANGTPGTYTRDRYGSVWTKQ